MSEARIVPLRTAPQTLETIVNWIDKEWGAFSGRSRAETRARFAAEFESGGQSLPTTLVAIGEEGPLGLASLRHRDSADWDPNVEPWVCNVYVAGAARGQGIAAALCGELEALARHYGYTRVYLATTRESGSLYHRLGYRNYDSVAHPGGRQYLLSRDVGGDPRDDRSQR